MNFLTKTLGSFAGYNIPYTFGDKIQDSVATNYSSNTIWNIYEGTSKADSTRCTIFEFDLKNTRNTSYIPLARNSAKKLKSTRIPGVLKVLDTIETDSNIYIFSEPVVPLSKYLVDNEPLSSEALLLGIYVITKALKHLNVEGGSVHGNVDISSIFISESGEWRLGGFELLTNTKSDPEQALFRYSSASPTFRNIVPPEVNQKGIDALRGNHQVFKLDAYKLGGLIWCLFNNVTSSSEITSSSQFLTVSKIPKPIQPTYKKLLQNSITTRITVEVLLNQGERSFFNNDLIHCYKELDELNLKSNSEKLEFMRSLENVKKLSPPGFMEYKIIPELIRLFTISIQPNNFQTDMSNTATCLYYILSFSEKLDETEFKKTINPVIIHGFSLADRTVRVTLLTSLPKFIDKLSKSEVSDKIFTNLLTGFSDTNPTVREETLKAVLPISSKLSDRQLNNELLRYLAKLQNDEKPEIRTNTAICLCKIAQHLNSHSRPGVLITAYNKSLKDRFVPARMAALLSFESCIEMFSPEICCSRILSSVAPCLLDKSSKVRKEAKKVFDLYMAKINEEAERLPAKDDDNDKEEDKFSQPNINEPYTSKEAANLTSNIQSFGFNLAMGAFTKMSGIGGQMEATHNVPTPTDSRSSTPAPSSFFSNSGNPQSSAPLPQTSSDSLADELSSKLELVDDSVVDADDGWGFDIDDENNGVDGTAPEEDELERELEAAEKHNDDIANSALYLSERLKTKPVAKPTTVSGTKKLSSTTLNKKSIGSSATHNKSLKLGNKKLNTGSSKLQLQLTIDEDDKGWGDGW